MSLATRLAEPSTRGTKDFCINFYRACFLHWRVETIGKLKAKDQSWCGNKKEMVVTWEKKEKRNKETEIFHYISKMGSCMVLTFFLFFFFLSSDNFPLETYIKQKSTPKKVPRENWRKKNFCVVNSRARRPVNSRHKSFLYKFLSCFFFALESWN